MEAGIRRVAIMGDDAEDGYTSPGPEWYDDEPLSHSDDDEQDERDDSQLAHEVNRLLGRGWTAATIARYLGVSESEVNAADYCPEPDDFAHTPEEAYGVEPDFE